MVWLAVQRSCVITGSTVGIYSRNWQIIWRLVSNCAKKKKKWNSPQRIHMYIPIPSSSHQTECPNKWEVLTYLVGTTSTDSCITQAHQAYNSQSQNPIVIYSLNLTTSFCHQLQPLFWHSTVVRFLVQTSQDNTPSEQLSLPFQSQHETGLQ